MFIIYLHGSQNIFASEKMEQCEIFNASEKLNASLHPCLPEALTDSEGEDVEQS
jgi:hypothetical protein